MTSFLDFWGCGKGPCRQLAPATRILCGTIVFVCCFVTPVQNPLGIIFFACVVAGWTLLCGIPWKTVAGLCMYACVLFLPLFLLVPWIEIDASANNRWANALAVPLEIGIRGTACIFICVSTVAILDLSEFHRGLAALPLPRMLVALILQIIHQTAMLTNESRRIACVIQVRGTASGCIPKFRFFSALPAIWLLRIMNRAERVAAAMDLRGFEVTTRTVREFGTFLDGLAVTVIFLLLGTAITIRWINGL